MHRLTITRTILALSLSAAGLVLAACSDDESATPGPGAGGGAAGEGGEGGTGGEGPGDSLYVDSELGDDGASGTFHAPLKTIGAAIAQWSPGQSIVLFAGVYSAASGEAFDYTLPDGAILKANSDGVHIVGTPDRAAFSASNATIDYVSFEGFESAIIASTGTQTFHGVTFDGNDTALVLGGDASVSLEAFSGFTGRGKGATLNGTASLSMTTGTITDVPYVEALFKAEDASTLALTDVSATELGTDLLWLDGAAAATLTNTQISNTGANEVISLGGDASLTMVDSGIYNSYVFATAIESDSSSAGHLEITDSSLSGVSGGQGYGLWLGGATTATMTNIFIQGFGYGGMRLDGGDITVTDSYIGSNDDLGIEMNDGAELTLRNTTVRQGDFGVLVTGTELPDLGTAADPGNNDLADNTQCLHGQNSLSGTLQAVGNTWKPNLQSTDAMGHHAAGLVAGPIAGNNFGIPAGVSLQF